mmetsp:Transcript_66060/g.137977  ORF Transcript_66060/g.137977 Transcript_66060/m.137977 type:complete len:408 (+) Transcript_66060:118-1341(+)
MGSGAFWSREDVTQQPGFASEAVLQELVAGLSAVDKGKLMAALAAGALGSKEPLDAYMGAHFQLKGQAGIPPPMYRAANQDPFGAGLQELLALTEATYRYLPRTTPSFLHQSPSTFGLAPRAAYLSTSARSAEPWKVDPSALLLPDSLEALEAAAVAQLRARHIPETFVPPPNLPLPYERAGFFEPKHRHPHSHAHHDVGTSYSTAFAAEHCLPPPMLSQPAGLQPPLSLHELAEVEPEAVHQTPSPAGTEPSCRSRGASSTTVGDAADSDESTVVIARKPAKKQNRSSKLKCDIILKVTVEEARDFQLVPRLIGANGRNMKGIVDTYGAKIRIRGRGSGYYETKGPRGMREADIPLQMVYRAEDKANFEAGLAALTEQLEAMGQRFARFCESRDTAPPSSFYEVRR